MAKAEKAGETPQEIALAEISMARLQDYRKRWAPLVTKLRDQVRADGAQGSQARRLAAGKATTDNEVRFSQAGDKLEAALTGSGAAPSSGKFKTAVTGLNTDQAAARGMSMVASDEAISDAYVQGLGRIAAMGRGQSSQAVEGLGAVARRSAQQAQQDAEIALAQRAGRAQLVGQVAGFGLGGGFKGMGDQMQAKFSQTDLGGSGFGTGLAYGNQDIGGFI